VTVGAPALVAGIGDVGEDRVAVMTASRHGSPETTVTP
jgi:hypothetical protein